MRNDQVHHFITVLNLHSLQLKNRNHIFRNNFDNFCEALVIFCSIFFTVSRLYGLTRKLILTMSENWSNLTVIFNIGICRLSKRLFFLFFFFIDLAQWEISKELIESHFFLRFEIKWLNFSSSVFYLKLFVTFRRVILSLLSIS